MSCLKSRSVFKNRSASAQQNESMFIPSWKPRHQNRQLTSSSRTVEELKSEVHDLTVQTDRYRDQSITSLAVTTTAGLTALAGGALSMLSTTQSVGLTVAGIAGLVFAGGVGLTWKTNSKLAKSEAQRLATAGELFDTRKSLSRERVRDFLS